MADTVNRLAATPGLTGIVLTGPDVFDFDPEVEAGLDPLLEALSSCAIPVAAAIPGNATGAGLELALACSARIGRPGAAFTLPAVSAGRLPRATSLAALTRLVGVQAAANLVSFGNPMVAARAQAAGLLDMVTAGDLVGAATERLAGQAGATAAYPRRADATADEAAFFGVRLRLRTEAAGRLAPLAAARALEAAVKLPARRAAAEVARLTDDLAASPEGEALRYATRGERAADRRTGWDADARARLARRLYWPMAREAIHLLDEGATPAQVDRCLERYGFDQGVFARSDAEGLAHVFSNGDGALASGADWSTYSPTLDLVADAGRFGGASAGWYRAPDSQSDVRFDAEVDQLVQSSATFQQLRRAAISDDVILDRCLRAAINAAANALQAHGDLDMATIDAVWTRTLGFPRWRGGPLFQAQRMGPQRVADQLDLQRRRRDTTGAVCSLLASGQLAGAPREAGEDRRTQGVMAVRQTAVAATPQRAALTPWL